MSENKVEGGIEKALRVMGAEENPLKPGRYLLRRVQIIVTLEMDIPWCQAMVIHECKLYLRGLGFVHYTASVDSDRWTIQFIHSYTKREVYAATFGEEHEAYAKAVLAASGIEPTNSEPNEEQSVPTENTSSGGQG